MKSVCPLLLLAAASALELQSELPSNFVYTNKYQSSRNFNRLRWRTQGASAGDIVDKRGWLTGTPATFVTPNANWFGGCRLKAGEMYEEYMNTLAANAVPTRTPQHRNRSISGLVTYRCEDNAAATADGGTQDCYLAGRARGYKWDVTAIANAVGASAIGGTMQLSIYKPIRFATPTPTWDPNPEQYDMTKWCTIPSYLDSGAQSAAGVITPYVINQISSDGLTPTTATLRQSQFLSEEFQDPTAVNVLSATYDENLLVNSRYDEAGVVMQYGGYSGLLYDTVNALAKTYGSKDWTDLHAQPVQQVPNVACCKFEQWPKRTFMRYIKRIADSRLALTANTSVAGKTATIIAAPVTA